MKTQGKEKSAGDANKPTSSSSKEIKTDLPMSEKDEVKNAEKRVRKALKNHM